MFLTTSKLEYANYGASVQQLKERLNLPTENHEDPLGFLRNTCMEPYQASEAYVQILGEMFRKTVLTCIGAVSNVQTVFFLQKQNINHRYIIQKRNILLNLELGSTCQNIFSSR